MYIAPPYRSPLTDFSPGWRKEGGARDGRCSKKLTDISLGFSSSKRENFSGASEAPRLPLKSGYMGEREQTLLAPLKLEVVIGLA